MLDFTKPPFPENPACKSCMLRPCKQLFSGRVYPGKMIFAHRSDVISLPCHQPYFLKHQEENEEEVVLTDALAETMIDEKKVVTVTNPRWEHIDNNISGSSTDTAAIGDEVHLYVDVTGVAEGSRVTFDIFEVSSNPPMRIASASGNNEQGTACGKWTVEDPSKKGENLRLEFEGIAKSKASKRCPIAIEAVKEYEFTLYIDPEDPATYDDKVILKGIDSDYEQIKTVADDKIAGDGMLTVGFTGCKKGDSYILIHDDGQDQHIITEESVYGG